MRSLTTILAAVAIALSTCAAVNAAPQGNTSADRQLRQLEARYDTLSNLRYTNAYIEAEKRVLEAKIEKLKHEEISSKPRTNYSSSSNTLKQETSSASGLEIIGPENVQDDPNQSPIWQVIYDGFVKINKVGYSTTYISGIWLLGRADSYTSCAIDLSSFNNTELTQLNLSVWNEDKKYPSNLTFDSEIIPIEIIVSNNLKERFKGISASLSIAFLVKPSEAKRIYTALTSKTLRSMTIGDVLIPLDQFTDSKVIFRALLNRLGTKVSKARDF